jgi:pimeloyl-ACP methyl ester carboxylesterase
MTGLSEERFAPSNGIELAYQETGDPAGEPLLLIMGLGAQMLGWDDGLCTMLAERGYRVIRFDNRDIGRSTKIDEAGMPSRRDMLLGRRSTAAYFLSDMADDTAGLMDHLGISSAHVAGVSMGGMIAQTLALRIPERVLSLASIMSTTGSRRLSVPSYRAFGVILARSARTRDEYVEQILKAFRVIGSPAHPKSEAALRQIAERSYDRGHHPAGVARQLHAVGASGDRTRALASLDIPAVVIHGSKDPLVRPAAGRATAKAIPGARMRMIEGMGHDLPEDLWQTFVDEIAGNAARPRSGSRRGPAGQILAA